MVLEAMTLVAMKLTQQARECTNMKREADVESGACGQEKLENNELCKNNQVLVRSGKYGRPLLSLLTLKLLGPC